MTFILDLVFVRDTFYFPIAIDVIVLYAYTLAIVEGAIHDKLTYHEVINIHNSHVRHKRSTNNDMSEFIKEFHFQAFNRSFTCNLTPRLNFFSPNFILAVYGENGKPVEHSFRRDQIYVGKCDGDPDSEIRGTFKEGIFSGTVHYDGELYGVENAKFHIQASSMNDDSHMLVYRANDIIWQEGQKTQFSPSFCGNIHLNISKDDSHTIVDHATQAKLSRRKRSTATTLNTCKIIAVADYKFFQGVGRNNIYDTALYMANVIDRVDNIYRKTFFNLETSMDGFGFEIAKMVIYRYATNGFNAETDSWDPLNLLQAFSRNTEYKNYCAAHLFTHQSFFGNVLGLAYIAPPREGQVGGICSPLARLNEHMSSLNTAWSSTKNQNGDTVLLQQANLVTAHELGHNWGAEHDPETSDCSPSTSRSGKGKYLMYPYSVSGYDANNLLFSPCSRELMSRVLKLKRDSCFSEKSYDTNQVCGNGIIDEGEECDAGLLGRFNLDSCCNNNCQLIGDATCSPANHECCMNCTKAPSGYMCTQDSDVDCFESAFCNGFDLTCPKPSFKKDNSSCLDKGQCRNGKCIPFCAARNLTACACEELSNSCQRCCRKDSSSPCIPFDGNSPLPNGRPCIGGYCQDNVCKSSKVSTIQRLFQIFENLSVDKIVQIFRTNVVGCVIVFSLILWIPATTAIWCQDRKARKQTERWEDTEIRTTSLSSVD
uniref:Peptidase M12B domain-containing protein n=1 Tax=Biomphalaria glabrata TaxID=6526 RepID=A0A2C9KQI0_BIOGL